ncbi:MAG: acyltransferase [Clostridia bacterium]|nr:acyltransferase [Clostridia bacterium]
MNALKERKTYTALDVGKFICSLVILFYHYFSEHGPLPGLLDEALSLYAVAVALFMVISGFLTYRKLETIENYADRKKYVFKQVKRIFTVYLLWSIPYLAYTIGRWDFNSITAAFVFKQIRHWIFGSTFYTIWFMPALGFGLLLSFFLVEKLPKKLVYTLAAICYTISALTLTYSFFGKLIPGYAAVSSILNTWLGGTRGWLVFAFPLLMLGRAMVRIEQKLNWKIMAALSVVSMLGLLAEALILRSIAGHTGIDTTFMMIPVSFCILGFLISFNLPSGSYSVFMRSMSVLIFMTQRLFLTVIPDIMPTALYAAIFSNIYVGALVVCGTTVIFSVVIILLTKNFKFLKYLY